MKIRFYFTFAVFFAVVGLFMAFAGPAQAAEKKINLKLAHVLPVGSNFDVGARKFKELLEESSGGRITVQIYAGDMTGDEVEAAEMIQSGNLDMGWLSTGSLSAFVKDLMLLDMPFLFEDTDHVNRVLMGPIGDRLLAKFDGTLMKAIAFHEDGWREITSNKKPINSLSDVEGLKVRIMMNDMNADMYKALGALPTPIPSGEIYSSLQTGLVNGQDNGVLVANNVGYIEVQPYVCMIRHFYSSGVVLISEKSWKKLSDGDKVLVREAAVEAGKYQRAWFWKAETDLANELEAAGKIQVTYPEDRTAWVEAVRPVYRKYFEKYPEWESLVQSIKALQ